MQIISYPFVGFVLVALIVYYLLPRRVQNIWLLIASYGFYCTLDTRFALMLAAVTLVNFFIARRLWGDGGLRKGWLWAGVGLNLLALSFLKLGANGYLLRLLNAFAPGGEGFNFQILLPVGFSFYILQAISYLIDVSRKQLTAGSDLIDFALYMAYFPRLTSGPIERARTFLPQLARPRIVDNDTLVRGLTLIVIGLVRKLLISGGVSTVIQKSFFQQPFDYANTDLILGLFLYAFWLYNDFAGYTSIVRGISTLFGIELSQNFQQPFFSRNFTEFWNRWHISLSHWLRDYIYFPLSRTIQRRTGSARHWLNILLPPMVTMLASGLWHDFGAYMLVWGGLHGLYQVVERGLSLVRPSAPPAQQPAWRQVLSALTVFLLTTLAWVPFASGGFSKALRFWQGLFLASGSRTIAPPEMVVPLVYCGISLLIDRWQYHAGDDLVFLKFSRPARAALMAAVMLAFLLYTLWSDTAVTNFIYQGF